MDDPQTRWKHEACERSHEGERLHPLGLQVPLVEDHRVHHLLHILPVLRGHPLHQMYRLHRTRHIQRSSSLHIWTLDGRNHLDLDLQTLELQ